MIKAVIIDDEQHCRALLKRMISDFIIGVEVLGEAHDAFSATHLIKEKQPNLVFLDIEMPGGNGFKVLNAFEELFFQVIFTTSYDQYAMRAVKYPVLDYLLKPIGIDDLEVAINKYRQLDFSNTTTINFHHTKFLEQSAGLNEITLTGRHGKVIISIEQIAYIEARGDHLVFHLNNLGPRISTQSLSFFESILPADQFFRIHKSYMVNCTHVRYIENGRSGNVVLKNGIALRIATRRKAAFVSVFNRFYQKK